MNTSRPTTASRMGYARAWGRLTTVVRRMGGLVTSLPHEPGVQTASWPLSADLSSVPRVRRLTRARLAAWGLEGCSDVVELLVSELVTNALCHAPGSCRLTLSALDGLLRCEVEDTSTELPGMRNDRAWDEGGRGLYLLDMLSCCWGGSRTPTGKTMWFELPTGDPRPKPL